MADNIVLLDPQIRNWVLYPIFIITLLVGLGRHYVTQLVKSEHPAEAKKLKAINILSRSARLRTNARFIPPFAFKVRKEYLAEKKVGALSIKQDGAQNPMMSGNSNMQMDMMKGQMTTMIPSILMMTFVNHFFSGYVISKVPFPLTPKFKMMLQQGVQLSTLDSSYVSSLSWYFLVMFGLNGVYKLVLGANANYQSMQAAQMQMQMGMVGGANNPQFDAQKAFQQEKQSVIITKHSWLAEKIELEYAGM
jgi:ER membrane protein complex subunit 3